MEQAQRSSSSRLSFIDFLRGLAVFWMIEVHVVDVCLSSFYKQGFLYDMVNISNGFVSVAFIFCAGIGFEIAFQRKGEEYLRFGSSLWLYLRRLGHILLLAYWLHLPAFSLERTLQSNFQEWQRFYDCDVLQTIGFSSILALVISMIVRDNRVRRWLFLALSVLSFSFIGQVWHWSSYDHLPMFPASLIAGHPLSKFPLVPFSGYFFGGISLISFYLAAADKNRFALRALIAALCAWALSIGLKQFGIENSGTDNWWEYSLGHGVFRTSVVVSTLFAFYFLKDRLENTRIGKVLTVCGQESLFMYVSHLMLVYGTVSNFGLVYLSNRRWDVWQTALVFVLITVVCYSFAEIWHGFKKTDAQKSRRLILVLTIGFIIIFALVPSNLAQLN